MTLRRASALILVGLYTCNCLHAGETQQDLIRRIDAAQQSRDANLAGYTVTEYYTIRNSHFSRPAEATIEATYKRGEGNSYKVLSRTGPSLLQNTALDRLLREEGQMTRGKLREQALITSANYDMKLIGREPVGGNVCYLLELTPRRKSPYLLKGRIWVDPRHATIVKVEGKPPASASFFEGRPQIVREYKDVDGVVLAHHIHVTTSTFLFGQTTLDIEDREYHLITNAHSTQ